METYSYCLSFIYLIVFFNFLFVMFTCLLSVSMTKQIIGLLFFEFVSRDVLPDRSDRGDPGSNPGGVGSVWIMKPPYAKSLKNQ